MNLMDRGLQAFYICEQTATCSCLPWNVFRCICSGVESISAEVNSMESKSKYWGLVSKKLNTDIMPFIFVKF